jgi:hypothetical protein
MKLANMVDLGSAGLKTLQVQVLPIVFIIYKSPLNKNKFRELIFL